MYPPKNSTCLPLSIPAAASLAQAAFILHSAVAAIEGALAKEGCDDFCVEETAQVCDMEKRLKRDITGDKEL